MNFFLGPLTHASLGLGYLGRPYKIACKSNILGNRNMQVRAAISQLNHAVCKLEPSRHRNT